MYKTSLSTYDTSFQLPYNIIFYVFWSYPMTISSYLALTTVSANIAITRSFVNVFKVTIHVRRVRGRGRVLLVLVKTFSSKFLKFKIGLALK